MQVLDWVSANIESIVIVTVLIVCALVVIKKQKLNLKLLILNTKWRFPLLGKARFRARNPEVQHDGKQNWFNAERESCEEYQEIYEEVNYDSKYYDECKRYLNLVGEAGRKPLTKLIGLGLFIVLVLEAWGFSYTLAMFLNLNASEETNILMAYVVACMFAVLLAAFTHAAGQELYRNSVIKKIRQLWQSTSVTRRSPQLIKGLSIEGYGISHSNDEHAPSYQRNLNRLQGNSATESYNWTIGTIALTVLLFVLMFFIRYQSLELQKIDMALCDATQSTQQYATPNYNSNSLSSAPKELTDIDNQAKQKMAEQQCDATTLASWATFIVLGIVFMGLQVFAIWVSWARGFAGEHSNKAYEVTHKYASRGAYNRHHEKLKRKVAQNGQQSLTKLQGLMSQKLPNRSIDNSIYELLRKASQRTFTSFLLSSSQNEQIEISQHERPHSATPNERKSNTHSLAYQGGEYAEKAY